MTQEITYTIAPEIIQRHEAELIAALPKLYPDESERTIVENVLIPQFCALIQKTLADFNISSKRKSDEPLSPSQIPDLCAKVDDAIQENKDLLESRLFCVDGRNRSGTDHQVCAGSMEER